MLEGAEEGIIWYIKPKFETLQGANVWADAASQIFYSLGIACGSLVTLASYSKFTNNCHRCDFIKIILQSCVALDNNRATFFECSEYIGSVQLL